MRNKNYAAGVRSFAWGGSVLALVLPLALAAADPGVVRPGKPGSQAPLYFLASQPGQPALDRCKSGGSPFGSALAELLGRPQLAFGSLLTELVELTERNSRGKQRPEVPAAAPSQLEKWQLRPKNERENRVALVLVFAEYSRSGSMESLQGARSDLDRVAAALEEAGFATTRALDPSPLEMKEILERFAAQSSQADVALLYATGHGVEVDQVVYLLPGDFSRREGKAKLEERATRLAGLGDKLKAKNLNLVFYGGCRTNLPRSRKARATDRLQRNAWKAVGRPKTDTHTPG